jgi:hypothetical protein
MIAEIQFHIRLSFLNSAKSVYTTLHFASPCEQESIKISAYQLSTSMTIMGQIESINLRWIAVWIGLETGEVSFDTSFRNQS